MAFHIGIDCKLCAMNQGIWKMMAKFLIKFYCICLRIERSQIDMNRFLNWQIDYYTECEWSDIDKCKAATKKKTRHKRWQRTRHSICKRFIGLKILGRSAAPLSVYMQTQNIKSKYFRLTMHIGIEGNKQKSSDDMIWIG